MTESNSNPPVVEPLPEIRTQRLLLRPFSMTDVEEVQRICGIKEIAANTRTIPHPYPAGAAEFWIKQHPELWSTGKAAIFCVCLQESDEVVAAAGLEVVPDDQHAELGYWVDKPHWGNGIATEAAQAVIHFAFDHLKLHRVFAHHMTRNPASGRVMEKAGMKKEGFLRGHTRKWGVFEDIVVYGILKSDLAT